MTTAPLIDLHFDRRRFWPDHLIRSLKKVADHMQSSMEKIKSYTSQGSGF
jgi:hypothetical protein